MYDASLSKLCQGCGAMQKKKNNKRCIPKEGMPHASACQKKRREKMHTQRRYATCLGMSKTKKKIAPYPKGKKKRDGAYKGVHTPFTKNIHTLAHLDQSL